MLSFLMKYKHWIIIGIILIIGCMLYIGILKYNILTVEKSLAEATTQIEKLQNENDLLAVSLTKSENESTLKNTVIDGLQEKTKIITDSKSDEVSVWRKKYEYCISSKNSISTKSTTKIMDEETNKVYIDLYNTYIFK